MAKRSKKTRSGAGEVPASDSLPPRQPGEHETDEPAYLLDIKEVLKEPDGVYPNETRSARVMRERCATPQSPSFSDQDWETLRQLPLSELALDCLGMLQVCLLLLDDFQATGYAGISDYSIGDHDPSRKKTTEVVDPQVATEIRNRADRLRNQLRTLIDRRTDTDIVEGCLIALVDGVLIGQVLEKAKVLPLEHFFKFGKEFSREQTEKGRRGVFRNEQDEREAAKMVFEKKNLLKLNLTAACLRAKPDIAKKFKLKNVSEDTLRRKFHKYYPDQS